MAHHTSTAVTSDTPTAIRPATLRGGLALAVLAALAAFAVRAQAQQGPSPSALESSSQVMNVHARTNPLGSGAIGVQLARPVVVQFGESSPSTPPGPQDSSK
jgi:hypothetical protein